MSRWLDHANGFAVYARDTLAAVNRWPLWRVLIADVVSVALSCAASWRVAHYWENSHAQAQLNVLGDDRRICLQDGLVDLEQMMNSAARQFQSAKEIGRAEFSGIIDGLRSAFDATLKIDWAPRVLRQERATHERAAAFQGLAGYHISTRGNDGVLVLADAQGEYFPILYSTRATTAPTLLGLDISSDSAEQEAMTRARESGGLVATPPPAADPGDIFLFAPVYGFDLPHEGIEERRSNFEGFLRGSFLPGPLIDKVFRGVKSPQGLDIYFFRQGAGPNEPPFHVRSSLQRSEPAKARSRADLDALDR
jgi:hypothetical protein